MGGDKPEVCTRRNMLAGTAMFALGGVAGMRGERWEPVVAEAPPLPWEWVPLDPLEAGRLRLPHVP